MSGPADEPFVPPRKKVSVLWWIAGVFFLLLVFFFYQLFGPNPRIVASKQTTFITGPLGSNGLPDYEQYVLEMARAGVRPENNAVALLWPALFPADVDPQFHSAVAAELGLTQIPSGEDALTPLYHERTRERIAVFLIEQAGSNEKDDSTTNDAPDPAIESQMYGASQLDDWNELNPTAVDTVLERVRARPWTSDKIPPLAAWVAENKVPLDLIVEASRRPRYYAPSPTLLNNDRDLLISMLLPYAQSVREAARALPARAMLRVGEGRADEAWQDLFAVHRLSRLVTQGYTLVEQLVAVAMSESACAATVTLLHHADLTAEQARAIQQDLSTMPKFAAMARSIDTTERLSALDAFIGISQGGGELFSAISGGADDFGNGAFNVISVDWNLVLRDTNDWYDRLAAAARIPDRRQREMALAKVEAEMQNLVGDIRSPGRLLGGVVSRQQRSKIVSSIMLGLFLPAVTAATNAEDRTNTTLELTRLAAALAVYRAEQGAYPEKLDELVPGVLEKLPLDVYNSNPFGYQRMGEGYLLYSIGENGVDDGGSNVQYRIFAGQSIDEIEQQAKAEQLQAKIPVAADDFSIRVPRSAFELPKLQTMPQ